MLGSVERVGVCGEGGVGWEALSSKL